MKKEKFFQMIYLLFMMVVGGVAGAAIVKYVEKLGGNFIGSLLYALFCFYLAFFLTVVIHEGGHLVMGLKTGYQFLSFRIGSLTLVKQDGRYAFKKFNIAGTGGQCLLMPPPSDDPLQVPFVLYHLGGGLFNLLTAVIFLPLGLWTDFFYLKILFVLLGAVSAYMGVLNLLPVKIPVATDGYNILNMLRHPLEREALYKQLRINGLMYEGATPAEIPAELYKFGGKKGGIYEGMEKLLMASVCIEKREFEQAQKLLEEYLEGPNLLTIYRLEANCELLFCKIMNGASDDEIEKLYDKELKSYVKTAGKTQISKKRLLYAYDLLYKKDETAAEKEYAAAMKMKNTYPNVGELKSELTLIDYIRNLQGTERRTA